MQKMTDMEYDDQKEKSSDDEKGLSGPNPSEETSVNHQPDKQIGVSDPMYYPLDKKEPEKAPRIMVSNLGTNTRQSEGAKAPSQEKAGSDCLIQEKVEQMTEKTKESLESAENKSSLLDIDESTSNELKRKDDDKIDNER